MLAMTEFNPSRLSPSALPSWELGVGLGVGLGVVEGVLLVVGVSEVVGDGGG